MKKITKKKFFKGIGIFAVVGVLSSILKRNGSAQRLNANDKQYTKLAQKEPRAVSRDAYRA